MHEQTVIDNIMDNIDLTECETKVISLMCSKETLRRHLEKDIDEGKRSADVIERSLQRIPLYEKVKSTKNIIDGKSIDQISNVIMKL